MSEEDQEAYRAGTHHHHDILLSYEEDEVPLIPAGEGSSEAIGETKAEGNEKGAEENENIL